MTYRSNKIRKFATRVKLLTSIVIIAVFVMAANLFYNPTRTKMEKRSELLSTYVGKGVVIGKDTLVVVNYNTFGDSFTLSNNLQVDSKIVFNQVID